MSFSHARATLKMAGVKVPRQKNSNLKLEEVLGAGQLRLGTLLEFADRHGLKWASRALEILIRPEAFQANVPDPEVEETMEFRRKALSSARFGSDLEKLMKWGVLSQHFGHSLAIKSYCYYSKVRKANGAGRAIFDAREANAKSHPPPAVNLPLPEDLIKKIIEFGPAHYLTCDAKNMFYLVPINDQFQLHLVLEDDSGGIFLPQVCCMGHSWSPYLCTAAMWSTLFFQPPPKEGQKKQTDLKADLKSVTEDMPRWVDLIDNGEVVGFVVCWIDDALIVCRNKGLLMRWSEHLCSLAKESWTEGPKVMWKEMKFFHEGFLKFIGIEFQVSDNNINVFLKDNNKVSDTPSGKVREWRLCEEDWRSWVEEHPKSICHVGSLWSPRMKAEIAGMAMWVHRLTLKPLFLAEKIIELSREATKDAGEEEWDALEPINTKSAELIMASIDVVRQATWNTIPYQHPPSGRVHYMAADASTTYGLGVVHFGDSGEVDEGRNVKRRPRSERWSMDAVYLLELRALEFAVDEKEDLRPGDSIVCAVDNTAEIGSVRRGYSKNPKGRELVKRIWEKTIMKGIGLTLKYAHTSVNAADPPSRNVPTDPKRNAETWELLQERDERPHRPVKRNRDNFEFE